MWGGRGAALIFDEPYAGGHEGLNAANWQLSLAICQFEILADAAFTGASGGVIHDDRLPRGMADLLFGRPSPSPPAPPH